MNGKSKCKILREIRLSIARENGLELATRECTYQGECRGTCPRCEAEVRELERQLAQKQRVCKRVAAAVVLAGVTASLSGCAPVAEKIGDFVSRVRGNPPGLETELTGMQAPEPTEEPEMVTLAGEEDTSLDDEPAFAPEG